MFVTRLRRHGEQSEAIQPWDCGGGFVRVASLTARDDGRGALSISTRLALARVAAAFASPPRHPDRATARAFPPSRSAARCAQWRHGCGGEVSTHRLRLSGKTPQDRSAARSNRRAPVLPADRLAQRTKRGRSAAPCTCEAGGRGRRSRPKAYCVKCAVCVTASNRVLQRARRGPRRSPPDRTGRSRRTSAACVEMRRLERRNPVSRTTSCSAPADRSV